MTTTPEDVPPPPAAGTRDRLIEATVTLLATEGPSAIKARTVAAEAGMSTMVVYNYFGGVPELVEAVVDYGFTEIRDTFSRQPMTDDPVSDLFSLALSTVAFARSNPHLYDALFGLSTRATYRPPTGDVRRAGHSPAFQAAYAHLVTACGRLAESGRMTIDSPNTVASSVWSVIHGYITLELAEHFIEFSDPSSRCWSRWP